MQQQISRNPELQVQNTNRIKSILLKIMLLLTALTTLHPSSGLAGEKLQIFYSNDVCSELEACG